MADLSHGFLPESLGWTERLRDPEAAVRPDADVARRRLDLDESVAEHHLERLTGA